MKLLPTVIHIKFKEYVHNRNNKFVEFAGIDIGKLLHGTLFDKEVRNKNGKRC